MFFSKKTKCCIGGMVTTLMITWAHGQSFAAETKIGIVDAQTIIMTSSSGKKAQEAIEAKKKSLEEALKKDGTELENLQKEMEKKGAAWSEKVKDEKSAEFQKKRLAFMKKQEEANKDFNKAQEQHFGPLEKKLHEIVTKIGKDEGYTLIVPRQATFYYNDTIDITKKVATELDK